MHLKKHKQCLVSFALSLILSFPCCWVVPSRQHCESYAPKPWEISPAEFFFSPWWNTTRYLKSRGHHHLSLWICEHQNCRWTLPPHILHHRFGPISIHRMNRTLGPPISNSVRSFLIVYIYIHNDSHTCTHWHSYDTHIYIYTWLIIHVSNTLFIPDIHIDICICYIYIYIYYSLGATTSHALHLSASWSWPKGLSGQIDKCEMLIQSDTTIKRGISYFTDKYTGISWYIMVYLSII